MVISVSIKGKIRVPCLVPWFMVQLLQPRDQEIYNQVSGSSLWSCSRCWVNQVKVEDSIHIHVLGEDPVSMLKVRFSFMFEILTWS